MDAIKQVWQHCLLASHCQGALCCCGLSARTLQRYVKEGMPRHCAVAAHTWWVGFKAKAAQQPLKKPYIAKPGDIRMVDLARQLDLSSSYTGQLVKKGMPATSKAAALAWRATNVHALSVQDDLYVTMTHLHFVRFRN
jgi:hypothetical protein